MINILLHKLSDLLSGLDDTAVICGYQHTDWQIVFQARTTRQDPDVKYQIKHINIHQRPGHALLTITISHLWCQWDDSLSVPMIHNASGLALAAASSLLPEPYLY